MSTASTGRTHDYTRPICIDLKTTLAKWGRPHMTPARASRGETGVSRIAVTAPERTMTPVKHKIRALVGEAAIREHPGNVGSLDYRFI